MFIRRRSSNDSKTRGTASRVRLYVDELFSFPGMKLPKQKSLHLHRLRRHSQRCLDRQRQSNSCRGGIVRLIRSSHKSKFKMQEVTFENLTANDKKLLIKHYYEEPVDFIDAKNKHKVGRSCESGERCHLYKSCFRGFCFLSLLLDAQMQFSIKSKKGGT